VEISSAHAGLAEIFLGLTLWMAMATSPAWKSTVSASWKWRPARLGLVLTFLVWLQIVMGALIRHSFAGLAIPTFPLAFGSWIPPFWSQGIALNFLHTRVGALLVSGGLLVLIFSTIRSAQNSRFEKRLSWLLLIMLFLQITLGITTLYSGKNPLIASLHLSGGAAILSITFALTLLAGLNRKSQTSPLNSLNALKDSAEKAKTWVQATPA
jgi:cytochrome c oxidase assembly protein subunit 15